MKRMFLLYLFFFTFLSSRGENGYDLWLRYKQLENAELLQSYRQLINTVCIKGNSPTITAVKSELEKGLTGLLGRTTRFSNQPGQGTLLVGVRSLLPGITSYQHAAIEKAGEEGFMILSTTTGGNKILMITGNTEVGVLYGVYHFLRLVQSGQPIRTFNIVSAPRIKLRLLNHWDNLDRHVERGYAGISLWNWHTLPDYIDKRYIDYARANASIGINGTVLTNVNANAMVLTRPYLEKIAALANTFRPYGIRVYLTARFSAPVESGNLSTADPLNDSVKQWWSDKAKEIYQLIPDFGGFLVKANSEGQPGPQSYGRNHAEGANMLAAAVAPFNGIVMWRAFVYSPQSDDRFKQAYDEFKPLDGKFLKNVLVQVKNGPIDFQPREPFSPLFGSMPSTPLMMEFQVTQEYLGQGTHLVYEAPMFREILLSDTHAKGLGSTVAGVVDGTVHGYSITGMAGVSNIGNDINWTGHLFGQANWYALGRLAWDHALTSEHIAEEWIRQTFTSNRNFITATKKIMLDSYEAMVNYMTPLGLHHIMGNGHHYGPAPWSNNLSRPDWNPVYYHKADKNGIGFDRTITGTNALAQYTPAVRKLFEDPSTCEEKFLLWFHHVSWDHRMRSGRTLWDELCFRYNEGVKSAKLMADTWNSLASYVDAERHQHVSMLLGIQLKEAIWWRDACLSYFQSFSNKPYPAFLEKPAHTLEYYKLLHFPYAPGN